MKIQKNMYFFLAILFFVCLAFSGFTQEPTPGIIQYGIILGDVNYDSNINIIDALMIAHFYVGEPFSIDVIGADVNCDGSVNIVDALIIARLYVGLMDSLPCEAEKMCNIDLTYSGGFTGWSYNEVIDSERMTLTQTVDAYGKLTVNDFILTEEKMIELWNILYEIDYNNLPDDTSPMTCGVDLYSYNISIESNLSKINGNAAWSDCTLPPLTSDMMVLKDFFQRIIIGN